MKLGSSAKSMKRFGGPGRDRTDDLFHAMEARSQLRHRPTMEGGDIGRRNYSRLVVPSSQTALNPP